MVPLAALLFARRRWHDARRVRVVLAIAASYVSLFALLLWQALRGQPVTGPDSQTLAALVMWTVMTAFAVWLAGRGGESPRVHAVVY
jgi:hypothetical protein